MSDVLITAPPGGDYDKAPALRVIVWVEATVGTAVLLLRLFTRTKIVNNLGWDDFWMVVTWVMCIITNALDTVGMHYGIGRHLYYLTPYQRMMAVKYDWISHAFAITATGLGKVAFALFLLRVIAANNKAQRWFLHGYNILLIAINIPLIIITYAQCSPTKALWDPSTVGAKCWDPKVQATYAVFQGCYGVAADLALALFPITILWNLQLPRTTKLGLAGIMSLGVFAAGCAIMKTVYLPRMTARADFTYETTYMIIWFTTEMYVILIAASIPTLRPLIMRALGKSTHASSRGRKGYYVQDDNGYHLHPVPSGFRSNKDAVSVHCTTKPDHESERSILPSDIRKTTEVTVSYDDGLKDKQIDGYGVRSIHPEERF